MMSEEDKAFLVDVLANGLDVSGFESLDCSNMSKILAK